MNDLTRMLLGMNQESKSRDAILRAPFGYPGGKSRSILSILPHLPMTDRYVEPFGGSGAVMLSRDTCKLEVLNDRYAGVTAFYRCLHSPVMYRQLIERLELIVHSREEFVFCKATWEDCDDLVERAARWFYHIRMSFGSLGRNFGRSNTGSNVMVRSFHNSIKMFAQIHNRIKNVSIENQDWEQCMEDYDHPNTVFYLDPPYIDSSAGVYKHELSPVRHEELIGKIFKTQGFVAVSGYSNPIYDNRDWDHVEKWRVSVSIKSTSTAGGNNKEDLDDTERGDTVETLWIKESRG